MNGKAEDRSNMEKRPLKRVVYWCIGIALPLAIFAGVFLCTDLSASVSIPGRAGGFRL